MAGLQVGTAGGEPTVQVARPGLGDRRCSLGGGDCQRKLSSEQAPCLTRIRANSVDGRPHEFSICNPRIVGRPDLGHSPAKRKGFCKLRGYPTYPQKFSRDAQTRGGFHAAQMPPCLCESFSLRRNRDLAARLRRQLCASGQFTSSNDFRETQRPGDHDARSRSAAASAHWR
jgi:hypothetical protein